MSFYAAVNRFNKRKSPVLLYVMSFACLTILSFLAQLLVYPIFPSFGILMLTLRTGTILPGLYGGFRINYIGFIIPLIISAVLAAVAYRKGIAFNNVDKAFVALFVIGAALSLVFKPIEAIRQGTGIDVPMMLIVALWMMYFVYKRRYAAGVPLSYALLFLVSALSDTLSVGRFIGGVTFGGFGILDGDFLLPLSILIAMYIASVSESGSRSKHSQNR